MMRDNFANNILEARLHDLAEENQTPRRNVRGTRNKRPTYASSLLTIYGASTVVFTPFIPLKKDEAASYRAILKIGPSRQLYLSTRHLSTAANWPSQFMDARKI
ncbi:hypothetical protein WG66_001081 [Moniliophthora roreri]|nr:hypothetical protein WG66_001081 [Moniliophthora roreri]